MKQYVTCMTYTTFSCVKVITGGQLPCVRGLWGHLLHTVHDRGCRDKCEQKIGAYFPFVFLHPVLMLLFSFVFF